MQSKRSLTPQNLPKPLLTQQLTNISTTKSLDSSQGSYDAEYMCRIMINTLLNTEQNKSDWQDANMKETINEWMQKPQMKPWSLVE